MIDASTVGVSTESHQKSPLTPKQRSAVTLLATGMSVTNAARKVQVDRSTLWEWRQREEFRTALEAEVDAIARQASSALRGLAADAVEELRELLTGAQSESVRLRAAHLVLERLSVVERSPDPEAEELVDALAVIRELTGGP